MGYDPRIGFEFLHPGPGYGGSCFPKDVAALLHTADEAGYDFGFLARRRRGEPSQHERIVVDKLRAARGRLARAAPPSRSGASRSRPTPTTSATRPRCSWPRGCSRRAPRVQAYDPAAGETAAARLPGLDVAADPYDAAAGASVLALLTEWDEFRWLDFDRVRSSHAVAVAVVDARNLLDPAAMRRRGFAYQGVGR